MGSKTKLMYIGEILKFIHSYTTILHVKPLYTTSINIKIEQKHANIKLTTTPPITAFLERKRPNNPVKTTEDNKKKNASKYISM
jgi:hypothetical protein